MARTTLRDQFTLTCHFNGLEINFITPCAGFFRGLILLENRLQEFQRLLRSLRGFSVHTHIRTMRTIAVFDVRTLRKRVVLSNSGLYEMCSGFKYLSLSPYTHSIGPLDGGSARRKTATYIQNNTKNKRTQTSMR
jgi:hypothetical protein